MKAAFLFRRGESSAAETRSTSLTTRGLGCTCSQGFTQGPSGRHTSGTPPGPPTRAFLLPPAAPPSGGRRFPLQLPRDVLVSNFLHNRSRQNVPQDPGRQCWTY